jgi:hypothetical protein
MFGSKEKKEERKERQAEIKQLENQLKQLNSQLKQRLDAFERAQEAYTQSVSPEWEYTQVSDKEENCWPAVRRLGRAGWEMVGISNFAEGGQFKTVYTLYVFKRRVPDLPIEMLDEFGDISSLQDELEKVKAKLNWLSAIK